MSKVPLILSVDRRDNSGYGLAIRKAYGNAYLILIKEDPYERREIRLDFHLLLGMLRELEISERKEENKRLHAGIRDD